MRLWPLALIALVALTTGCPNGSSPGSNDRFGTLGPDAVADPFCCVDGGPGIVCTSAAECMPGQICCVASGGTVCQQPPCGPEADTLPAVQVCRTSAECTVQGDTCVTWRALSDPSALQTADAAVCASQAQIREAEQAGVLDASALADASAGQAVQGGYATLCPTFDLPTCPMASDADGCNLALGTDCTAGALPQGLACSGTSQCEGVVGPLPQCGRVDGWICSCIEGHWSCDDCNAGAASCDSGTAGYDVADSN